MAHRSLASLLVISASCSASLADAPLPEYGEGQPVPRHATAAEKAWMLENPFVLRAPASAPPVGVMTCPGEYVPSQAIIFAYENSESQLSILRQMVAKLTTAGEADCYISTPTSSTTTRNNILSQIAALGGNTARVKFLTYDCNAIWMRDYGPRYGYENNVRVILDHNYNRTTRTLDDAFPPFFANQVRHAIYHTGLLHGGGNFHLTTSGRAPGGVEPGNLTELITNENPGMSAAQVESRFEQYWGVPVVLRDAFRTSVDGTQHIDMWMQIIDDDRVMISDFPNPAAVGPEDAICEATATQMATQGYQVFRLPAYSISGVHYTYTNVVMCNDIVLIPLYNSATFVSATGTSPSPNDVALATWQAAMPGKQIIQIDCDGIVGLAGVMHCIMMHIPEHLGAPGEFGGLAPTAFLKSHNGGQAVSPGSTQVAQFIADDDKVVTTFDVLLSTDGQNFNRVIAANRPLSSHFSASDGNLRYTFTVPAGLYFTDRAKLRVLVRDAEGNTYADDSDAPFTISGPVCNADWDYSSTVDATDVFYYLDEWFAQNGMTQPGLSADADGSGSVNATDIFAFLDLWFAGC